MVILPPASNAIEVRTVIGRIPAALTAFRGHAGAASAPEIGPAQRRLGRAIKPIVGEAHDEAARLLADNRDRLARR